MKLRSGLVKSWGVGQLLKLRSGSVIEAEEWVSY